VLELALVPGEPLGCDSHPSRVTHERLGRELSEHLRMRLRLGS
jgi:hypothetical protein